jgi:hypothetical protein
MLGRRADDPLSRGKPANNRPFCAATCGYS